MAAGDAAVPVAARKSIWEWPRELKAIEDWHFGLVPRRALRVPYKKIGPGVAPVFLALVFVCS